MRGNNTGFAASTPLLGISSDCCSRVLADLEDSAVLAKSQDCKKTFKGIRCILCPQTQDYLSTKERNMSSY